MAATDAPNPPVLILDSVAKRWDDSSGLEAVSFAVGAGDLTVVQGRSGSGKSTLLAILAGWCDPDGGLVSRVGEWAGEGRWRQWRSTSIVPQVLANLAELSVRENVMLPFRLAGRSAREAEAAADELVERLDLAGQADRRPGEISMGQQQRLAVARALTLAPTLLLADEPTSHQDAGHAALVMDVLSAATAAGTAVIVASHDPMVASVADQVVRLGT